MGAHLGSYHQLKTRASNTPRHHCAKVLILSSSNDSIMSTTAHPAYAPQHAIARGTERGPAENSLCLRSNNGIFRANTGRVPHRDGIAGYDPKRTLTALPD